MNVKGLAAKAKAAKDRAEKALERKIAAARKDPNSKLYGTTPTEKEKAIPKGKGVDFLFDREEWKDALNYLSPRHKLYWRENFNLEPTLGRLYPNTLEFSPKIEAKKNKYPDPPTKAQEAAFQEAIAKVMMDRGWMPEDGSVHGRKVKRDSASSNKTSAKGFVYFVRNQDLHKVGITLDLQRRLKELSPDEVINTVKCSNYEALELRIHKKFSKQRVPQTEYFRLSDAQVSEVEEMMMAEVK